MTDRKRTIEVDFVVDDKDKRKLKGIGDEATTATGKFDGLKGAVGGFLTVAAAQQLGQFAIDAAQMAEKAQIAADSAEKVLGPALQSLHEDLEGTRQTMGLNSGELDTLIAQYGLLTDSLGLADDAQATFIEWLITTGGELAAYKGDLGLSEEAVNALGGALRGEFDSLETFGIKVNQAAVNERKLKLEADPANASLDDQQLELLALQQIINEKAAPALGSLADAQDGLAGKTNQATARFDDLKIQIGTQLLPVVNDLLTGLLDIVDGPLNDDPSKSEFFKGIAPTIREIDDWANAIEGLIGWLGNFFDKIGEGSSRAISNLEGVGDALVRASRARSNWASAPRGGIIPGGGGRQHGGPVHAGQAYTVGERGPETFIPGANGRILPAGGMVNNITINAGMGADPNAISKAVVQALQRYERSNGAIPIRTRVS